MLSCIDSHRFRPFHFLAPNKIFLAVFWFRFISLFRLHFVFCWFDSPFIFRISFLSTSKHFFSFIIFSNNISIWIIFPQSIQINNTQLNCNYNFDCISFSFYLQYFIFRTPIHKYSIHILLNSFLFILHTPNSTRFSQRTSSSFKIRASN